MVVGRLAFLLAATAALMTGCGPALPPAGNYATVSGRVTDAVTGDGVAGVTVTVNTITSATTDATGTFKIANVPTGLWDYALQHVPTTFVTPPAVDNPTPLTPGEQRTLTISLTHR